jgi:uncharacterized protein
VRQFYRPSWQAGAALPEEEIDPGLGIPQPPAEAGRGTPVGAGRRGVPEAQLARQTPRAVPAGAPGNGSTVTGPSTAGQPPRGTAVVAPARPRRFYAKISLDPNRPRPQVSNIAQSILSELDRTWGTTITLTLDIDAESADGFPEDVENVVRDNARSLRITDFGFEGE